MFDPEGVAVVGASKTEGKVGNAIVRSLERRFQGSIYPVNPKYESIEGHRAYESVSDIDENVDLAIIGVPAEIVPEVVKNCGEGGVKNIIIVSAGFREAGRVDLEEDIKRYVDEFDLNVIGPNCLGIFNSKNGLDTIFNPPDRQSRPPEGSIAFLSQSGAFGAALLDWFSEIDIGISKFVSYGNRVDIDEGDLLRHFNDDTDTDILLFYIEGLKDGRDFVSAAYESNKPILAFKSGKTEKGSSAATSHTGSLAGKDKVYEAAFKQSVILRASSVREMISAAKAISMQPFGEEKGVGIVTNGGGAGITLIDAIVEKGLEGADFSKRTNQRFREKISEGSIPQDVSFQNPVDILGDASSERYHTCMELVLEDKNVGGLIVVLLFQSPSLEDDIIDRLRELQGYKKPIVCMAPGSDLTEPIRKKIEDIGIPVYETPEEAAQGMKALMYFG